MVGLFSSPQYTQFIGTCVSLTTSHSIVLVSVLRFVYSQHWILGCQSMNICHFSGSHVEILFRLFSLRTKWNRKDGKSAKAVREQVFLLRYKSTLGGVESSVSRSSACCQYCRSCPWSVVKNWKYSNMAIFVKVHRPYLYLSINRSASEIRFYL